MTIRPARRSERAGRPARPGSAARQHQTRVRHHDTNVIGLLVDRIESTRRKTIDPGRPMKQMLGIIAAGDRVGLGP